mmetsp:Transcript_5743/g.19989  ORF Transcript_5743/g.19989 Transcript_5743/m.19989 type:complete len:512 (-) Transcript_5743:75-1610(-)
MAGEGGEEVLLNGVDPSTFRPSIYQLTRRIKRDDHGVYNCLRSVDADALGVARVRASLPGAAAFANLRCGAWYLDAPDGTCYFKSTDGHAHNWSFSTQRLNLHVAAAAAAGDGRGALVVDATRSSTKRFPDALAKTVPVWAAVVNAACAELRGGGWSGHGGSGLPALPPWVSELEREAIAGLMPRFVQSLLSLDPPGLRELASELDRPLEPRWVSAPSGDSWGGTGGGVPLVLLSASEPLHWRGERRQATGVSGGSGAPFAYIPGAADDEESWSLGLTAEMFLARRAELLAAGPGGCEAAVRAAVKQARRAGEAPPLRAGGLPMWAPRGAAERPGEVDGAPHRVAGTTLWLGRSGAAGAFEGDAVLCGGGPAPASGPRGEALNLGVADCKLDRTSLKRALPAAVAFAAPRLGAGRGVLVACGDGRDRCAAVAVALLMQLYDLPAGGAHEPALREAEPKTEEPSKEEPRRALAVVAASYPAACPARGMLKQAYAYAREARAAAAAAAAAAAG